LPRIALLSGNVAESIIEAAQQGKADAIVVGRRGRGPISGLLLGSVSQQLVQSAPYVTIVSP
jgi:nucleotide-binding universal stress UspA family protein